MRRQIALLLGWACAAGAAPSLEELGFPPRTDFDHQRGAFAVRLDELPPLAAPAAILDRLTADGRRPGPGDRPVDPAAEVFFVYVPESYSPTHPHGLLVWISPTELGGVQRPDLRALLGERKLIWIGAHRAGNERAPLDRHALGLVAATVAPRHWAIDPQRLYVGGYSGGGRTASQLALRWPELFRGGLFVMGCNWFASIAVPDQPGRLWQASFPAPDRAQRKLLQRERRLVFVTSAGDFNRDQTRATERAARSNGFRQTTYLETPAGDHFTPLPPEIWQRALAALDGEL